MKKTPDNSDNEELVNYITSFRETSEQVYDSTYDSDSGNYVAVISNETANK